MTYRTLEEREENPAHHGFRKTAATRLFKRKIFPQSKPHIKTRNTAMKRNMGIFLFLILVIVLMLDFFLLIWSTKFIVILASSASNI